MTEATGYSPEWIREISRRYNEGGAEGLGDRRHGNPGASPLLSPAEQRELSEALEGPPEDGGLWNSRKVAEWIERKTGRHGLRARKGAGSTYAQARAHSPGPSPLQRQGGP